jgi:hypothetical protein
MRRRLTLHWARPRQVCTFAAAQKALARLPLSPKNAAPPPRPAAAATAAARGPPAPTGSHLLALVPLAARVWVPYCPRGAATQAARQQVALNLAGSYLALLARELRLQPAARAEQASARAHAHSWRVCGDAVRGRA